MPTNTDRTDTETNQEYTTAQIASWRNQVVDYDVTYSYTYDVRGNILTCTGSLAGTLGKYNPFRYRGYVYDEETGLYYLNSRYYDPKVGRFICADGYSSTGQGLLGMNAFAYCGNKPSDRKDSNGTFYDAAWEYHKMRQEYAQMGIDYSAMYKPLNGKLLPDLDIATAPAYSYNCFGNAIKKKTTVGIMGYTYGMDTEDVFSLVQKEIGINYVRCLDGIDSPLDPDEYMVAMKCGERDYHFIRRDDEGWYNKSGLEIGVRVDEYFVENDPWYAKWRNVNGGEMDGIDPYVYTTIYFAIKAGWDQQ